MTEHTYNIIRCCKASLYPEIPNRIERVKAYLTEATGHENYTDAELESVLRTAVYDYIDTCDKPSFFLRSMDSLHVNTYNDRVATAFALVRVLSSGGTAINGFARFVGQEESL